jgi:beta-mannosidase
MQQGRTVSLAGPWRFRTDPERLGDLTPADLVRTADDECAYYLPTYDDSDWQTIPVPGNWQQFGHDYNGVAWYRTRFVRPEMPNDGIARLRFAGVDYYADVWLNGCYLGSHEGFFAPFTLDCTPWLAEQNVLVVRVESPNDVRVKHAREHEQKTLIKGALQDWDVNNLDVNPGGIWGDVTFLLSGPQFIERVRADADLAAHPAQGAPGTGRAALALRLTLVNTLPAAVDAAVRLTLAPATFTGETIAEEGRIRLLPGPNVHTLWLQVPDAHLWWTWDQGRPDLYELTVTVGTGDVPSDSVTDRIGLRTVERRGEGWATYLNGRRLFWRGANYLSDQLLGTMTTERYAQDVRLLKEANMNMVRPFCVVEHPAFYAACDAAGLLVYQDFPMQWRMSNDSDLVRRATRQVEEMIALLANRPSVFLYCYGSEPGEANFKKLGMALAAASRAADPTRITHQANEYPGHWEIMAERAHYGWPVDLHFYSGWYPGTAFGETMYDLAQFTPEHFEVVTEYGAQALPTQETLNAILPPEQQTWPPSPRALRTLKHHCMQPELQFRAVPDATGWQDLIAKSQAYQALVLKFHTEYYRRMKYEPCNGALMFTFNDCWPAVTWSVVDYYRRPKQGYYALQQAFAPLHIMLNWTAPLAATLGAPWQAELFVVNDLPRAFPGLTAGWLVRHDQTGAILGEGSLPCDVAADCLATPIGALPLHPPADAPDGACTIALRLTDPSGDIRATNAYTLTLRAPWQTTTTSLRTEAD